MTADDEDGFTLVEVVVALLLLAIVMTSALTLFVRSLGSLGVSVQRQQAVQVANQLLEQVRAVPSYPATLLLAGRSQTAVNAIWAAPGVVSTSQSVETWDSTATTSSTPTVPTTKASTIDGITYSAKIFIDTCYQASTGSACTAISTAGATAMYRVSVGVTWAPGGSRRCATSTGTCGYAVSTLIDLSADPTFNTN